MARRAALLNNTSVYDEMEKPIKKRGVSNKSTNSQIDPKVGSTSKLHMSLKDIKPLTEAQRQMVAGFESGTNLIAAGSAGVGKSYLACYLAIKKLLDKEVSHVKIIRTATPVKDIGFLPGDATLKQQVYELPYKDIVADLLSNGSAYEIMTKKGVIEFSLTSFQRGLTFRDCVVIVDEFASMTVQELRMLATRVGENCQIIFCGDTKQRDVKYRDSGYEYLMKIAEKMPKYFDIIHFSHGDILRSDFCKSFIIADEEIS